MNNQIFWDDGKIPPTPDFEVLPDYIKSDLTQYLVEGNYGGSDFLYAVLINDLSRAIGHCDGEHLQYLRPLVSVIYNRIPRMCWGGEKAVASWQELGGWNGYKVQMAAKT